MQNLSSDNTFDISMPSQCFTTFFSGTSRAETRATRGKFVSGCTTRTKATTCKEMTLANVLGHDIERHSKTNSLKA